MHGEIVGSGVEVDVGVGVSDGVGCSELGDGVAVGGSTVGETAGGIGVGPVVGRLHARAIAANTMIINKSKNVRFCLLKFTSFTNFIPLP